MKKWWRSLSQDRWIMTLTGVGYVGLGMALLPAFRYQINPDGISYLDIANFYLHGRWPEAVNAYWGPLYSWLLVPLLAVKGDPLLATKLLNLALGLLPLGAVAWMTRRLQPRWAQRIMLAAFALLVLLWALAGYTTPDLLLLGLVLAYAAVLTNESYRDRTALAVVAGALGGLAYLGKSYALPFFLLHFSAYHGWRYWSDVSGRRQWARQYALGLAAFVVLFVPWVVCISLKYHHFTYGTSGAYNLALAGPGAPDHPMLTEGLMKPANGATSAWLDPSYFHLPGSGLGRLGLLQYFAYHTRDNLEQFLAMLERFWLPGFTIAMAAALALLARRTDPGLKRSLGFWWLIGGCYLGGYLIVFLEDRYLWPVYAALVMVTALLMDEAWRQQWFSKRLFGALTLLVIASLVNPAAHYAKLRAGDGRPFADAAQAIRALPGFDCRALATTTRWDESLFIAYHLQCPFYGMLPISKEKGATQLRQSPVNYILVWDKPGSKVAPIPDGFEPVAQISQEGLKILSARH